MRALRDLLPKKHPPSPKEVDEKTVFHVAKRAIVEEYGVRGGENIIPALYKDNKLFLAPRSSLWASEISLQHKRLSRRINDVLGADVVKEIKVARQQ